MVPRPEASINTDCKQNFRAHPESDGDEIVISGMAGRFPNSRSVSEFESNLYDKVNKRSQFNYKYLNYYIKLRCVKL